MVGLTAAALGQAAGAVIGGVAQAGLGVYQVVQGRKDLAAANAEIQELRANAPSLATPSAFSDYYAKAMDRSNLEFQNTQIARRQASNVQALSRAGGRALLGGLGAVEQQSQEAQFGAAQQQMQREMQAAQVFGGAQQQTQQLKENRFRMDLQMSDNSRQSAQATMAAGLGAAIGGLAGAGAATSDAFAQQGQFAADRAAMAGAGRNAVAGLGFGKVNTSLNPKYKYNKKIGG